MTKPRKSRPANFPTLTTGLFAHNAQALKGLTLSVDVGELVAMVQRLLTAERKRAIDIVREVEQEAIRWRGPAVASRVCDTILRRIQT